VAIASRTRAELIAEILRDYERYGDAMRYLNANVQEILRLIAELRPQPPPAPRVQAQSTGGMRPDASENSQISPSTIVRGAAGSHPHLASVLLQGRKSANIHASSGVIRGNPG
jgi:hypothetical protein